jgi:hypothetical protein
MKSRSLVFPILECVAMAHEKEELNWYPSDKLHE